MNSYRTSIELNGSKATVFTAISNTLEAWWGKQNVKIDREGIIFKVSWGEPWYLFKVTTFQPNTEMVWECIDANQKIPGLTGVEKEWIGTKIHWRLTEIEPRLTRLNFKHEGLVPEFICFNFCSQSWEHFLKESLKPYITGLANS
jgi:hypothetical protein